MQGLGKYLVALMVFGSNGIFASFIGAPSTQIVFLRLLIGFSVILGVFLIKYKRFTVFEHKRDLAFLAGAGVAMGIEWLLLFEAYSYIGVGFATLLNYVGPIIVIALAPIVFKEKLTWNKMIGIVVVVSGVMLINGATSSDVNIIGVVLGLSTALLYAVVVMLNKKVKYVEGMESTVVQMAASLVTAGIAVLISGNLGLEFVVSDIPFVIELGVIGTGFACLMYFSSIKTLKAQSVAVLGYLEPLAAVALSVLILGEAMTALQFVGAALVIGGAIFAQVSFSRNFGKAFHRFAHRPTKKTFATGTISTKI